MGDVDVVVAVASERDLGEVLGLFRQYLEFYERPHPEAAVRAFLEQRFARGDSVALLARAGAEAVGLAHVYPTLSSLSLAPVWVLNDLFVTGTARGTGAGTALLREVSRLAAEAGAVAVALETYPDNTGAQRLYEREGFVRDTSTLHYTRTLPR
ncbi:GNAT family N-acetyltransferase [Kineococcus sp. NUM-3379]